MPKAWIYYIAVLIPPLVSGLVKPREALLLAAGLALLAFLLILPLNRLVLWLSIPALALSFAVWMLWSVVVVHLPAAGFRYSTNQLFWLTALPALCGATLRIFYAFAVPVIGGRRFTTLATASLLLPAVGIGLAVQDPSTPFEWMVVLALLCGLGGGSLARAVVPVRGAMRWLEITGRMGPWCGTTSMSMGTVPPAPSACACRKPPKQK